MSVESPSAGEAYRISVMKSLLLNPSERWVNTYELWNDGADTDTAMLVAAGQMLVEFERDITSQAAVFERMVISTWTEEPNYNPVNFISVDLSLGGTRVTSGDALSLEHVLKVRRNVATGRYGNIFIRCSLTEADVNAPSGSLRLVSESTLNTQVAAASTANLVPLLPGGASALKLVMRGVSKDGFVHTRSITGVSVGGVGLAKLSRRYFNRGG